MRLAQVAAGSLVLALIAAGTVSAAAPKRVVLATRGQVIALSADGARVAVATKVAGSCDRVLVWNAPDGRLSSWKAHTNCPGGATSGGQALRELALAGTRVAWLESIAGNLQDLVLWTATVGSSKETRLAFAENHSGAEGSPEGDYAGRVHGDGSLLAYDTWTVCPAPVPSPDSLPACPRPGGLTNQTLWTVSKGAKKAVHRGADSLYVVAVDAGRIAAQHPDGTVTLFDRAGKVLKLIAIPPGTFAGAALSGRQLAVIRNGTLEVYSTATALLTSRIPLPASPAPRLTDLQSGLAVYVAGRRVHVLRVSNRKSTTLGAPGTLVDAQLEAPGLFYAYNASTGSSRGRVVFLPAAKLLPKIR